MGREYKIYKTDVGYSIYRKRNEGKLLYLEYLGTNNIRTGVKDHAKVFYNQDNAVENLVVIKAKGGKMPITSTKKSESEEKREKTSWSEL